MRYAIWMTCYNGGWVGWTFSEKTDISRRAPYTDINDAYKNKVWWWPSRYMDFEVREISEEEVKQIQKKEM